MKFSVLSGLSLTIGMFLSFGLYAQVGINEAGSPPDPSAMLDVSGSDKGLLIPRMTTAERDLINDPAPGLTIFNLDCGNFNYFFNGEWIGFPSVQVTFNGQPDAVTVCSGSAAAFSVIAAGYGLQYQWQVYTGSVWSDLSDGAPYSGTQSATLSVTTDPGLNGNLYRCFVWNPCGVPAVSNNASLTVVSPPDQAGPVSGNTTLIGNSSGHTYSISAVAGASSYEWTVPSGATINSGAGTTSVSVSFGTASGDVCVTAINGCTPVTPSCTSVNVLQEWSCGLVLTKNHVTGAVAPETKTVSYTTVLTNASGSSKCWIAQNLGASQQPTNSLNATSLTNGWYFQWNRPKGWMAGSVSGWDSSTPSIQTWGPSTDPCTLELGSGWRLPTQSEWSAALSNLGLTNIGNGFNSIFKLHTSGTLFSTDGAQGFAGSGGIGFYQTSTTYSGTQGYVVVISTGSGDMSNGNPVNGFSARCIKD